jgi:hypothetical protein
MNRTWRKLGLLYFPSQPTRHSKLLTHAANPVAIRMNGDTYRVFFSSRDSENRSSVGAVDIDITTREVVAEHADPFFEHGPPGSFYADGVSIGTLYEVQGTRYLLFMGWQSPQNSHWRGDIGRLVVNSDLTLELDSTLPLLLGTSNEDPISLSYPWVLHSEEAGYRMWYGSTVAWDAGNGDMVHVIKTARSTDGNNWILEGNALPYSLGLAQAFSRPTIIKNTELELEMWFSYRGGHGSKYRIGYAVSRDGKFFEMSLENSGIDVSPSGWDSEMIEYPFVFNHNGEIFMLYNGNGFGKTGFGLAVRS